MDRRAVLVTALLFAARPTGVVFAQPQKNSWRIGFLGPTNPSLIGGRVDALREGLAELGYVEGQNITIEYRWAQGDYGRLPKLAEELVALRVDAIVAMTTAPAVAALRATTTIPVVIVNVADPVGAGLVSSLSRPGGNVTGVANLGATIVAKQLDLLIACVPKLSRLALLMNSANQSMPLLTRTLEEASSPRGIQLLQLEIRKKDEIAHAFDLMKTQKADGLIVLPEPVLLANRKDIVARAARARIPAMYYSPEFVELGGLMSYGANLDAVCRQGAKYVDKVLKGSKPADLPVEQPASYELLVNAGTAKTLAIKFPQRVLLMADRVIE